MHIVFQHTNTQRFHDRECMPPDYHVDVTSNGTAQVRESVGEALVEKYNTISMKEDS